MHRSYASPHALIFERCNGQTAPGKCSIVNILVYEIEDMEMGAITNVETALSAGAVATGRGSHACTTSSIPAKLVTACHFLRSACLLGL